MYQYGGIIWTRGVPFPQPAASTMVCHSEAGSVRLESAPNVLERILEIRILFQRMREPTLQIQEWVLLSLSQYRHFIVKLLNDMPLTRVLFGWAKAKALAEKAPEDSPKRVIRAGSPPKFAMLAWTNWSPHPYPRVQSFRLLRLVEVQKANWICSSWKWNGQVTGSERQDLQTHR